MAFRPFRLFAAPRTYQKTGQGVDAPYGDHQQGGRGDGRSHRKVSYQPADAEKLEPLGSIGAKVSREEEPEIPVVLPGVEGMQPW